MKLIDKDVLVAEIERRIKVLQKNLYENHKTICHLASLKQSLDTLEVKEVDLEKELVDYHNENFSPCNDGTLLSCETGSELTWYDYERIAKHFFELGLKAQKGK